MPLRRSFALVLAGVAVATLGTRAGLNMHEHGYGPGAAAWSMLRYYTIWMNGFVALYLMAVALRGAWRPALSAGLLLSIGAVALVYHGLLADQLTYTGLEAWVDRGFHTVVPLGFALFWLIEPKRRIALPEVLPWLALPLVYCAYALVRGGIDGRYPYFFLDLPRQGVGGVAMWIAILTAGFLVGALAIRALAGAMAGRDPR